MWIDSDIANAYLDILESGESQGKLDFLEQNKDLIGACNGEAQTKILQSLLDENNLINESKLKKFGFTVGYLTIHFRKIATEL